jgi:hypothetical protein
MISYGLYKVIHILGLILLFSGLGGILLAYATGTPKGSAKLAGFLAHGLGLLFLIVSGFGMAARLGYGGNLPMWIYAKLGVWLIMGLAISVAKRKAKMAVPLILIFAAWGTVAAWLALYKPF